LFGKRAKVNPAERVPELINQVRTSTDERRRLAAVEELRQYDGAAFPEIVSVLADVLRSDAATAVRAEAAHSLGRLRPASPEAMHALDAAIKDSAKRVRFQARAALLFYPASAARAAARAKAPPAPVQGPVVTTAPSPTVPASPQLRPVPSAAPIVQSQPLPADPQPVLVTPAAVARPLPRGPVQSAPQAIPVENTEPPLAPADSGEGPRLSPP